MKMKFIDSRTASEQLRSQSWHLVETSFPKAEQRSLAEHQKALADPDFHADLIMEEGKFIGIMFYWLYDGNYCFVEHFAISPECRNGGCGQKAMKMLLKKGYTVILEIDPPNDDISVRRQGFYERLGFVMNSYEYMHPAYTSETQPYKLCLMSYPTLMSQDEYEKFKDYAFNHVLKYVSK